MPAETTATLKVGESLPPLVAGGWMNGPPPRPGDPGQKLLLVDVWGMWCPFCESNAPALTRLHQKYAPRGVQFVGLTNMPDYSVQTYCARTKATWPNGYDAPPPTIAALGAAGGMLQPGYVAPVIYLVGPDGKVRWTDDHARWKHVEQKEWEKELDDALAGALHLVAPAKAS